ncbi:hypothetical protein B0H17DRAFT_359049 [Mycena rosella]|uniref:VHS domain-containing protein n=1 Tax=Mycena rosella TaxID=1033263 RepID=A0AAD7CPR9_MYCRO|nr:hypothetical protein B0H17DRAFT_359049 [Mycena rosella]
MTYRLHPLINPRRPRARKVPLSLVVYSRLWVSRPCLRRPLSFQRKDSGAEIVRRARIGGSDRAVELEREARERDRDRGRERRDEENELTRKIGFLTATASEDWTLLLDVCDHASANESNAKEAVRALRRELKSGEPAAQLAAARLWAIMLRNSSDTVTFISQSTSRKFLDTLEDLLTSSGTSPVVRERVMDVLAAAAYASGTNAGFRGLWRRVKPQDKPEEGVPFDAEDAMFNPPLGGGRVSAYDYDTSSGKKSDKLYRDHEHGIIPPEEDMRRLFQECKIGVGNATLLSQALAIATPEDLRNTVITEFHKKCMDSQELIFTQIPWASAGAERSRAVMDQEDRGKERDRERKRKNSVNILNPNGSVPDLGTPLSTREEELHAELLSANEELIEALKLYDDLKRFAIEREAENRSRKVRMVPRLHADAEGGTGGGSLSHSRSPSPTRVSVQHPQVIATAADLTFRTEAQAQVGQQTLAPPPAAPHGRLPGAGLSRTPSQAHPDLGARAELANGFGQIFGQLVMG